MRIESLETNIKPGPNRPSRIQLGRKITIVKGDHGQGKTRWDQALEFLFLGSVRDLAYRHDQSMRDSGVLLRLTLPTESEVYSIGQWDDGGSYKRYMNISKERGTGALKGGRVSNEPLPSWIDPTRVLPVQTIEANLRRKPEEVRALYLDRIQSLPLEEQKVLLAAHVSKVEADLIEEAGTFEGDAKDNPWKVPQSVDDLKALRALAKTMLDATQNSVTGAKTLLASMQVSLPEEPNEYKRNYLLAMSELMQGWFVVKSLTRELQTLQESIKNGRVNIDRMAPDPGHEPTPAFTQTGGGGGVTITDPFAEWVPRQQALLMKMAQAAVSGVKTHCPLCNEVPTLQSFATFTTQQAQQSTTLQGLIEQQRQAQTPVSTSETPEHIAWRTARDARAALERQILGLEAQAEGYSPRIQAAAGKLPSLQDKLKEVIAAGDPTTLGYDPVATLGAVMTAPPEQITVFVSEYNTALTTMVQSAVRWASWNDAKQIVDRQENRIPRLQRITNALDEATKTLLQSSRDAFVARMTQYMIPGWEPVLLLEDERGSESFRLALRVDGVLCYEPSGVQALSLMYAFALALDERNPCPFMVLTPPTECHISSKALPALVKALSQAPDHVQIILHTTGDVGKRVASMEGVVLVDLDRPEAENTQAG